MALLKTTTEVLVNKLATKSVDAWGSPIFAGGETFTALARVKTTKTIETAYSPNTRGNSGVDGKDVSTEATLSFNGVVDISVGDHIKYKENQDVIECTVNSVSAVKDFGGKVVLTKVKAVG